jgi:hypothetical protein
MRTMMRPKIADKVMVQRPGPEKRQDRKEQDRREAAGKKSSSRGRLVLLLHGEREARFLGGGHDGCFLVHHLDHSRPIYQEAEERRMDQESGWQDVGILISSGTTNRREPMSSCIAAAMALNLTCCIEFRAAWSGSSRRKPWWGGQVQCKAKAGPA